MMKVTDWRYTVGILSCGHFFSHFFKVAYPSLFPLMQAEFSVSAAELGLLVTAISVGSFLQLPVGILVDRVGAKLGFLLAIGITSSGVLLTGLAGTIYPLILLFSILSGIGQSAFHPSNYALIAAATDSNNEGKSFAVHNFGGFAGSATAPIIVGGIGILYGWREALIVTGTFGLLFMAIASVSVHAAHKERIEVAKLGTSPPSNLKDTESNLLQPTLLFIAIFFALLGLANAAVMSFAPLLSINVFGLVENTSNVTLTAFYASGAVGVLFGGVLTDRYDHYNYLIANTLLAAVLTLGIVSGYVPVHLGSVVGFFILLGLLTGLIKPARDQLVNSLSAADSTGKNFGLVFTVGTFGSVIGPVLIGAMIDAGNSRLVFFLLSAIFVVGAVVIMILNPRLSGYRSHLNIS